MQCYADQTSAQIIPRYNMQTYDQTINHIYAAILKPNDSITIRITKASDYFLHKPYLLGALGEGVNGQFDKSPLYRTDAFDCVTLVEVVLALVEAKNLNQFKQIINKIRYQSGQVAYLNRNHFISPDWNLNNINNHYLRDITDQFPAYKIAVTQIDKPHWYKKLGIEHIKLFAPVAPSVANNLLDQLHANSIQAPAVESRIKYLPLSQLFANQGGNLVANQALFAAIPSGSIIEIVQPNRNLTEKIGTYLDIEHMGFVIHTDQGLMFRAASSYAGRVVDVPLMDYLSYYYDPHRPVGINIEQIEPLKYSQK